VLGSIASLQTFKQLQKLHIVVAQNIALSDSWRDKFNNKIAMKTPTGKLLSGRNDR
jgi:hypothetical protein